MNAEDLCGTVLGTCTLQKVIGRGSMGAVFLAQQTRPRRLVAVKVLLPLHTTQPNQHKAFLERFRRETDAAASLEHPNILPVHEYGEREGLAYLVMPYVSGGTLRDELEAEGRLPLIRTVIYLEQMAAALDHAHERGVIHRDIKPANILMTPEKRLLLTDFGLVKIITDSAAASNPLSEAGMPMGTPDYMSPEQVVGRHIDTRTDIYSLGVLLYHMVTGTVPFKGNLPVKIAVQHLQTPPPLPRTICPDLPPAAEQVILRALAKKPSDRYACARDMASAFRLALEAAGVQIDPGLSGNGNEERNGNRKRGLFDPVWRNHHQQQEATPGKSFTKPFALHRSTASEQNTDKPIAVNAITSTKPPVAETPESPPHVPETPHRDIVEQTKMTLPSFSGIFTEAQLDTPIAQKRPRLRQKALQSLPVNQVDSIEKDENMAAIAQVEMPATPHQQAFPSTRHTPLPVTSNAEEQASTTPENVLADLPSTEPVQEEAGLHLEEQNDQIIAPKLRMGIGRKANLRSIGMNKTEAPNIEKAAEDKDAQPLDATSNTNTALEPLQRFIQQTGQTRKLMPTGTTGALRLTGALDDPNNAVGEYSGDTGMLKLNQAVKVVKIPVAGKPGEFKTGILPVISSGHTGALPASTPSPAETSFSEKLKKNRKTIVLLVLAILVILSGSIFAISHIGSGSASSPSTRPGNTNKSVANTGATATANVQATATSIASIIDKDSLSYKSSNWLTTDKNSKDHTIREFRDNAYHMQSLGNSYLGISELYASDQELTNNFTYTLTEQASAYDKGTDNAYYGMIIRYNYVDRGKNPPHAFFYLLRVWDLNHPTYQFVKVDMDKAQDNGADKRFKVLFEKGTGKEFHGVNKANTFTVTARGGNYTLMVNGTTIGKVGDGEFKTGGVGMGVTGKGTDVAFTNLLLTSN